MAVSIGNPAVVVGNEILRGLVGSGVHGTGIAGTDDRDEMGICVPPRRHVIGLGDYDYEGAGKLTRFEQWVYRTAEHATARSGPGDLDLTVYSLRKWVRLAAAGNPSILVLLYVPESELVTRTDLGAYLQDNYELFVSKQAGHRFLGYLYAQREKLLGERGNRTNRPELVQEYGFDTKFAAHMVRLGHQGVEFLTTGRITLPMPEDIRQWIVDLRLGKHSRDEALDLVSGLACRLQILTSDSNAEIPKRPDMKAINRLLVGMHEQWWAKQREQG